MDDMHNCKKQGPITSWYDLQRTCPKDPRELIAYAAINTTVGVFTNSTTFISPPTTWITSPFSIAGNPTCIALGSDSGLQVADAQQWNFSHLTANVDSKLAPPLKKLLFLRGGTNWQMNTLLNLGGATYNDIQLSFRDNAATRGDAQGTVPVFSFTGGSLTGLVTLSLVFKIFGQANLALRAIDGSSNYSMFELELIVTQ